jgi:phosphoserine aminotransferase
MQHRVINFNAGPAAMPLSVLERAQRELLDYEGTGMSIMEHSHRGKAYEAVHFDAMARLRSLLGIGDKHKVLLLHGGAHHAFATVPMNLLRPGRSADYVVTGNWGRVAFEEAKTVGAAREAGVDLGGRYTRIPQPSEHTFDPAAAYVHITSNNTIEGTQYEQWPDTGAVPLVADMSSDILWRRFDVARFGLVYACAQKNLGPSGLTLVIVRDDVLDACRDDIPKIFRFGVHAKNDSLYNTPPTFAIYVVRETLRWIESLGGLDAVERRNREKGSIVYGALDAHAGFYRGPVDIAARSLMNIVFRLPDEALEGRFVADAEKAGMVGLKGHRSVGGIRASMYNAVSPDDAKALADFMREFARKHG